MNDPKILNLLFTSAGRRSYLIKYFQNSLAGSGTVHAANSSEISTALQTADRSVITPLIYDDAYIPFLLQYCTENKIAAVIPLFDIDLPVLAQHRKEFESIGIRLVVADFQIVDICNDKWKTFHFLKENGFAVPPTWISLSEAETALENGTMHFPVMIKPRWGMGSIAVYEAENHEELRVLYHKVKREIFRAYLKFESEADIEGSVLIQEKIPGQEYGLDVVCDLEGNYCTTIAKKKGGMRSGETDYAQIVDSPELEAVGRKLALLTRHPADMDVDVFLSGSGIYILEMNARFGGGYPFSHTAGADLPLAVVKWLRGEKVDSDILTPQTGVAAQKDISMMRLYNYSERNL